MDSAQRRKIESRQEAERLVRELEEAGGDTSSFCRARGLDGRSLHCWRMNLARTGNRAGGDASPEVGVVRLVEVTARARPAAAPPPASRYRVVIGDVAVEVDDRFREDTLARLLGVVRSC